MGIGDEQFSFIPSQGQCRPITFSPTARCTRNCMIFIDLEKAYDFILRQFFFRCVLEHGVPEKHVDLHIVKYM